MKKTYADAARAVMVRAAPHASVVLADKPYGLSLVILSVSPEHRRTGEATAALRALTAHADALGITLSLTPDSCFGTPTRILYRIYLSHGFTRNRSPEVLDALVRHPVR